jgi:hypothetical protein
MPIYMAPFAQYSTFSQLRVSELRAPPPNVVCNLLCWIYVINLKQFSGATEDALLIFEKCISPLTMQIPLTFVVFFYALSWHRGLPGHRTPVKAAASRRLETRFLEPRNPSARRSHGLVTIMGLEGCKRASQRPEGRPGFYFFVRPLSPNGQRDQ